MTWMHSRRRPAVRGSIDLLGHAMCRHGTRSWCFADSTPAPVPRSECLRLRPHRHSKTAHTDTASMACSSAHGSWCRTCRAVRFGASWSWPYCLQRCGWEPASWCTASSPEANGSRRTIDERSWPLADFCWSHLGRGWPWGQGLARTRKHSTNTCQPSTRRCGSGTENRPPPRVVPETQCG